jgi:hypothetical protein
MVETVKVKHSDDHGNEYKVINKEDYNEKEHTLYEDKDDKSGETQQPMTETERRVYEENKAQKMVNANYGVMHGTPLVASDKNPSGTFSEPTPTDIRYPDKDATEFENNHGAFLGKSAAQMRETAGMDDKPGGLRPEVHEKVQEATAALAAASAVARPLTAKEQKERAERAKSGGDLEGDDLEGMTVAELKEHAEKNNIDLGDAYLKADIIKAIKKHQKAANKVAE